MINVTLTLLDILIAHEMATLRRFTSRDSKLTNCNGNSGDWHSLWHQELESCAAEIAFSSTRDFFLGADLEATCNSFKAPDLIDRDGLRWQIRHTEREDGSLIVRPGDSDADRYVLVTGKIPYFKIIGWQFGHTCKLPQFWKESDHRPGAWFVRQGCLFTDFDDLRLSEDEIEAREAANV